MIQLSDCAGNDSDATQHGTRSVVRHACTMRTFPRASEAVAYWAQIGECAQVCYDGLQMGEHIN